MRSERGARAPRLLAGAAIGSLLFLHVPLLLIFLYAFTTEEKSYQFPPPGFTLKWFAVVWERQDIWDAIWLSVKVAGIATAVALVLGTCAAAAVSRARFFGRDYVSLLFILPIALPGIITGISLRSAFSMLDVPFSTWTLVLGHATFCIVTDKFWRLEFNKPFAGEECAVGLYYFTLDAKNSTFALATKGKGAVIKECIDVEVGIKFKWKRCGSTEDLDILDLQFNVTVLLVCLYVLGRACVDGTRDGNNILRT